jgi:hypothetical protein
MLIHVLSLKSSGETYDSYFFKSKESVNRCLRDKGYDEVVYEAANFWEFRNSKDKSQTATVGIRVLVD